MNRTSPDPAHQELIERGKLTLQAILFQEQAARFKAEAAALQAALVKAENGETDQLRSWLEFKASPTSLAANDLIPIASESLSLPPLHIARFDSREPFPSHEQHHPSQELHTASHAPESAQNASHIDEPLESVSPWARMERAAETRLELARQSAGNLLEKFEDNDLDSQQDFESKSFEPADSHLASEFEDPLETTDPMESSSNDDVDPWDSLPDSTDQTLSESDSTADEPFSNEILSELSDVETDAAPSRKTAWWMATHVWVSLTVHALVVIALSVVVMSVAAKPQIVSIVAATVEADNVLMETPMEMISELETSLRAIHGKTPCQDLALTPRGLLLS